MASPEKTFPLVPFILTLDVVMAPRVVKSVVEEMLAIAPVELTTAMFPVVHSEVVATLEVPNAIELKAFEPSPSVELAKPMVVTPAAVLEVSRPPLTVIFCPAVVSPLIEATAE